MPKILTCENISENLLEVVQQENSIFVINTTMLVLDDELNCPMEIY